MQFSFIRKELLLKTHMSYTASLVVFVLLVKQFGLSPSLLRIKMVALKSKVILTHFPFRPKPSLLVRLHPSEYKSLSPCFLYVICSLNIS